MKSVAGREFAKALEQKGWELLRVQGSHHIYGKKGSIVRLSVPIHGGQSLKGGPCRDFLIGHATPHLGDTGTSVMKKLFGERVCNCLKV